MQRAESLQVGCGEGGGQARSGAVFRWSGTKSKSMTQVAAATRHVQVPWSQDAVRGFISSEYVVRRQFNYGSMSRRKRAAQPPNPPNPPKSSWLVSTRLTLRSMRGSSRYREKQLRFSPTARAGHTALARQIDSSRPAVMCCERPRATAILKH